MSEGPFGGPRPFLSDARSIIVLIGIDGTPPPLDIQISTREVINDTINQALIDRGADIKITRETVELTIGDPPTDEQLDVLGERTQYVQQYDIDTELDEVSQTIVNATHNTVIDKINELGFNITGTRTMVS